MSDGTCSCSAFMAGECCCGAWDEPSDEVVELQQQLASRTAECNALRAARDEACDCLEALDNEFGLSMKAQLQIEAWRAVGKRAK